MSSDEVDRYLGELDEATRRTLDELRRTLLELLTDAEQGLSYGVPAFRVGGKLVAGFSVAKHHLSYLPYSGTVLATMSPADLDAHDASKGALKFTNDNPLSRDLVAKLVAARQAELAGGVRPGSGAGRR